MRIMSGMTVAGISREVLATLTNGGTRQPIAVEIDTEVDSISEEKVDEMLQTLMSGNGN
jgi:hypothetical protein